MPRLKTEKVTVTTLKAMKTAGKKIAAVTAYDFPTAKVADQAGMDIILVGDSLGMVLQGHPHTLSVTMDQMIYHASMVSRATPRALVIGDMPFASFHISPEQAVANACRFVQEGGVEAVKIEGGRSRLATIKAVIAADIPVMAHIGLQPQALHALGGFKVQGKTQAAAQTIIEDAMLLQEAGVFSILIESVPMELAQAISTRVSIPTIGIGAGKHCDGQILVFHDLIGFTDVYLPKFVRPYADLRHTITHALQHYIADIQTGEFPGDKESYHMPKKDQDSLT